MENWTPVGGSGLRQSFEIEPGIDVWDYPWTRDPDGKVQMGSAPPGPFSYLDLYFIVVGGRKIEFAVTVGSWDTYTFYRRS